MATYYFIAKIHIIMNVNIKTCLGPSKNNKYYEKKRTIKLSYNDKTDKNKKQITKNMVTN